MEKLLENVIKEENLNLQNKYNKIINKLDELNLEYVDNKKMDIMY